MITFISAISLLTSAVMLYLAASDIFSDWKARRFGLRRSLDVIALSIGFLCCFVTSLYVLAASSILW